MREEEAHQARKRRLVADGATVAKKADMAVDRGRLRDDMRGKEAHQARKRRLEADEATVTKKADVIVEGGRPSSEMT